MEPPVLARPGFGARVLALVVDYGLILGYMAALGLMTLIGYLVTGELFNWLSLGVVGAELLGFGVLVLPVGVYLFLSESSARQATVGKRALGLRVVAMSGERPSRPRILVRTIVKLAPWEVAHFFVWHTVALASTGETAFPAWLLAGLIVADVLPLIYVLCVLLQKDRRGPHDLVAGTRVVWEAPGSAA